MTAAERKALIEQWQAHCKRVQSLTALSMAAESETAAEKEVRIRRLLADYNAFCEYYFPHFLTLRDKVTGEAIRIIHNAPFHSQAARRIRSTPNLKAVFKWPRGHAKSTHMGVMVPIWLMFQPKRLINFMVLVGKSEASAIGLLGDLQAELEYNQRLIADFGTQKNAGSWTEGEFKTTDGVKFIALGRGQSPRGLRERENRPDYILIDDLDDDELCRNERRVRDLTAWVKEALFGTLDVGRGRFIMVGNLISKNSVLANMCATKGVHVSEVKAVDDQGNPVWQEKWTKEEAQAYAEFVGYRAWQKEMMHNPITEGAIFKHEWIQWRKPLPMSKYVQLILYTDPSFKSTKNDYKASALLGKREDGSIDLIRAWCRQCSVTEMVRWHYDLYEEFPDAAITFMMEANFVQDILLDDFEAEGKVRGYQLPLTPDYRVKPDKLARIETISPLWERGFFWYNIKYKDTPDMQTMVAQTLALERGSTTHDDGPDACEGGIWYLQRNYRQEAHKPVAIPRRPPKNSW